MLPNSSSAQSHIHHSTVDGKLPIDIALPWLAYVTVIAKVGHKSGTQRDTENPCYEPVRSLSYAASIHRNDAIMACMLTSSRSVLMRSNLHIPPSLHRMSAVTKDKSSDALQSRQRIACSLPFQKRQSAAFIPHAGVWILTSTKVTSDPRAV